MDTPIVVSSVDCHSEPSQRRRRSSSFRPGHNRRISVVLEDELLEKLDAFLHTLERRLDEFEKHLDEYRHLGFDHGLERAYKTLNEVRDNCNRVGGEVYSEGMKRARAMVEVLENSYKDAVVARDGARDSLQEKAHSALRFCEVLLSQVYDAQQNAHASVDRQLERARHGIEHSIERAIDAKDKLADSVERAIKAARERGLITYQELPNPWRVNSNITRGYRFCEKKMDCVLSAFAIHNETCNIWTHAIGFILLLALAFCLYPSSASYIQSTTADKWITALFFIAASKTLVCSTIWHTMSSIAHVTTMERFACVDYTGISVLVAASILTTEYTAFYHEAISRTFYMTITILFGTAGVILPWRPAFNEADKRVHRVVFYVALGCTGTLPMAQLFYMRGVHWTLNFYLPIVKSLLIYITGAVVYASQVPECWLPGWFDWIGGSHNLWHVAVMGGIYYHYEALQTMFDNAINKQVLIL